MKYLFAIAFIGLFQIANAQYASLREGKFKFSTIERNDLSARVWIPISAGGGSGRGMRNAGRVLTIFGGVLFAGSVALYATAAPGGIDSGGGSQRILGFVVGIPSAVFILTPGVILWTKGSKRMKNSQPKVMLNLRGAMIGLRFKV